MPAYQTFNEHRLGRIEVGQLADFTVIGDDFFEMEEDRDSLPAGRQDHVGGRQIWPEANQ